MRTVLIVEDDAAIRRLMAELVREEGFDRVLTAGLPQEALAVAAAQSLDLVILDVHLGAHSGIELAERLRALPRFSAPVLVTTALPQRQAKELCDAAEACECLVKPFDIDEFLRAVRDCVASQEPLVPA
jgi:DNA-binding response OmpR family regulator